MGANIVLVAGYAIFYGLVHSLLASKRAKGISRRIFGARHNRYYRLAYNIISILGLAPFYVLLMRFPSVVLYDVPPPWRWLMMLGQVIAVMGLLISVLHTNAAEFLGLAQLRSPEGKNPGSLVTQGMYAYVRHPLYFFSLVFMWLTPTMTASLFGLYVTLSLYLYLGALHEESRLLADFGEAYRDYRERVPMLLPRWRPEAPADPSDGNKAPAARK
jgi:protein-S-isoprenylcysteine O-methyltransferase Ste14